MTDLDLRSVELFAALPGDDIARLEASLDERTIDKGEFLFAEGDAADNAYIVATGELEILKDEAGSQARIAISGPGVVVGEMALLTDAVRNASARAYTDATLLVIPRSLFDDIVNSSAAAMRAVFDVFLRRSKEQELRVRQAERMAQLGVLTAGLAHEMNNPASAVVRGAEQLQPLLTRLERSLVQLPSSIRFPDAEPRNEAMSALERADSEAAVEAALEKLGVANAWDLAPALAAAGVSPDALADFAAGSDFEALARALAERSEIAMLVAEIQEGAARLAELVGALKSYSFLDQAPVQETNITKGLDDTLLILRSKLTDIHIDRDYEPDLPSITAHGSQLNQVWTNLIDNAAYAVHAAGVDPGVIAVRVMKDIDHLVVEIEDNGAGIPNDVVGHVFEAFYTTKEPGSGTGIGLNTVYKIVVNEHYGTIDVRSKPGETVFRVRLPIEPGPTSA